MGLRSGDTHRQIKPAAIDVFTQILRQAPHANEARREPSKLAWARWRYPTLMRTPSGLPIASSTASTTSMRPSPVGYSHIMWTRLIWPMVMMSPPSVGRRTEPEAFKQLWDTSIHAQDILYGLSTNASQRPGHMGSATGAFANCHTANHKQLTPLLFLTMDSFTKP